MGYTHFRPTDVLVPLLREVLAMARIGAQKDEAGPAHLVEKAQMPPHPGEHVVDVKLEPDAVAHDDQIRWQCHVDPRILGVAGARGRGLSVR